MIRAVLIVLLLASLGVGSYVVLPIEQVEVVGHKQLSLAEVQQITGLKPGRPWLWAWPSRLEPLLENPWVLSATLERPAPGQLRIVLEERTSIANLIQNNQRYGLSSDGVRLPGAPAQSPLIEGRGEPPMMDLLLLIKAYPDAKVIHYGVGGYRIQTPDHNVWGQRVKDLQDWAKLRRIGKTGANNPLAQSGFLSVSSIYMYSWGVSIRR